MSAKEKVGARTTRVEPVCRWRARIVTGVAWTIFICLFVWCYYIEVIQHQEWAREARRVGVVRGLVPAPRGAILDRRGEKLALSVPVKTVCADPSLMVVGRQEAARALAETLGLEEEWVFQKLRPRKVRVGTNEVDLRYVVLKKDVPLATWRRTRRAMRELDFGRPKEEEARLNWRTRSCLRAIRLRGVFDEDGFKRGYPAGSLAGQVVGFVRREPRTMDGLPIELETGALGLELSMENLLQGVPGEIRYGRLIAEPREGLSVQLTIDSVIQAIAEREVAKAGEKFQAQRACALVIDPSAGDILAMANWPPFDPNRPAAGVGRQFNMAIAARFDPGSTMKVVTFAAGLEHGRFGLDDMVDCQHGYWRYASLHDHHAYGLLRAREVLAKSSNIGTAILAFQRIPEEELQETIAAFGFGQRTGVPLPGEVAGRVPRLNKQRRYMDFARVAIGHAMSATPLQVAMAMSAVANHGAYMRPRLVARIVDAQGRVWREVPPIKVRQVIRPETARLLAEALRSVVAEGGTAPGAALARYTVAGKTGTAQKVVRGRGYVSGKYYASFVGFFPVNRPRLCILVGVDEPNPRIGYYGSVVAAPVFRAIAEQVARYLGILPDKAPGAAPELGRTRWDMIVSAPLGEISVTPPQSALR